jgi:hypothetical protein
VQVIVWTKFGDPFKAWVAGSSPAALTTSEVSSPRFPRFVKLPESGLREYCRVRKMTPLPEPFARMIGENIAHCCMLEDLYLVQGSK